MRKLFGFRGGKTDDGEYNNKWDDLEDLEFEYDSEEEYYEEEDEAEYSEEYYEEEDETEYSEEYYEEEDETEYSEEYYEEEDETEYSEEYYEEEDEAEYSEEYYEEEDEAEYSEEYYDEEDEEYYIEEQEPERLPGYAPDSGNFFNRILSIFSRMDTVDRIVACTGVAVLILALVTGTVFAGTKMADSQVNSFATVGEQLDGIEVIGGRGLLAVADARTARQETADIVEDIEKKETPDYEEGEYSSEVTVALNMTSIKKDLKIKIINKKTGKLISNVPFEVTVTDSKGKSSTWKDEDKDGIIYKTDLVSGDYKVALKELTGYEQYKISTAAQSVKVKENLDYEKVDVADEIKTEAEVDASKEDTAKNDVAEESRLQDTVAWVESTKTPVSETYTEIPKTSIEDPALKLASFGGFVKLAGTYNETVTITGGSDLAADGSVTLSAVTSGFPEDVSYSWTASGANASLSSADTSTTTLTVNNTETKAVPVVVTVTAIATVEDASGNETKTYYDTASLTLNVVAAPIQDIVISSTSLSLTVGEEATLSAKQDDAVTGFTWTSDNESVATVDGNGKVTGVKAGNAVITVARNGASAVCKVKVSNAAVSIKLDKTSETLVAGKTLTITPSVTGGAVSKNNIKWSSSKPKVATVTGDNSKATVTGLKAGDTVITAEYTENGKTVKATCAVKVKSGAETDTTTALKDKNGNPVYVLNAQGQYVTAVYADYYKNQKFYTKQQGYKYTGWQTIDGKVYYFDANGNKVTGNQVIQGAQYSFDSDGVLISSNGVLGIDVSKWNGSIDWNAVKNSGVSYVIIRCGYRGSSQGTLIEDPKYRTNIQGAAAAGLKVGVYFFTQAVNEIEAVEEASMVLSLVKGYNISYPIFLDVESSGGRGDGISKETRTAVCRAFCQTIKNSGYAAGIYANKTWLNERIDSGQLGAYRIWLAQYASKPTYAGRYDIWQYSSKGQVSGIKGNVDLNLSYMGY